MKETVLVIGSSNTDLVIQAHSFPKPGETIMGGDFHTFAGGKGANQAVAASRLGGDVFFVAKVGNDNFGNKAIEGFTNDNIQTDFVFQDDGYPSGVAIIVIDDKGQNSIVVSSGANNELKPKDIDNAYDAFKKASIILIQLEIPILTVKHSLDVAKKLDKKVILNPAPAVLLDDEILSKIFLITPNESEAFVLTGVKVTTKDDASKAADLLLNKGVENVIITMGDKGAYFKNQFDEFHIMANKVKVVDTTAAGDIFNGALAVALAENKNWNQAILFANEASAIGVSRMGAQTSVPYRSEIVINNLD
jgi:ribokinase